MLRPGADFGPDRRRQSPRRQDCRLGDEGADGQCRAQQRHRLPLLPFVAHCDTDPYTNNDIRLALKYGIDRQKIVDAVYKGFATIGNDTTVAPSQKYFAKDIPQRPYDPDKAAFHFKKAGMANATMELQGFPEKAPSPAQAHRLPQVLYQQEAMKKAGLDLQVKRVSGDGYWDNVWRQGVSVLAPRAYWGWPPDLPTNQLLPRRPFLSNANWNDTQLEAPEF